MKRADKCLNISTATLQSPAGFTNFTTGWSSVFSRQNENSMWPWAALSYVIFTLSQMLLEEFLFCLISTIFFPLTSLTVVTYNHINIKIQMPKLPFIFIHSNQGLIKWYKQNKLIRLHSISVINQTFCRILFNKWHGNNLFNLHYLSYPSKPYFACTDKKQRKY